MLTQSTLKFLTGLKKNNSKEWFDKNRPAYETAREEFAQFVQTIIDKQGKNDADISMLQAKSCLFRINRDIRFSKNKDPYKANFGAWMARGGKKAIFAGYYFHLEPGNCFAGGGIWMPQAPELKKIRQEIDYCFAEFKKTVENKKFKNIYGTLDTGEEMSLVNVPKGYEKDNPAAEYLKLKSIVASHRLSDEDITSKDLVKKVIAAYEAIQPLVLFINKGLE